MRWSDCLRRHKFPSALGTVDICRTLRNIGDDKVVDLGGHPFWRRIGCILHAAYIAMDPVLNQYKMLKDLGYRPSVRADLELQLCSGESGDGLDHSISRLFEISGYPVLLLGR